MREGEWGKHICIQDTGSQGLGELEDGLGEGSRRQTTKGAGNRPDTWSWGVEGQKGKPEEQLGVQVSEVGILGEPGKARAK